MDQLLAATEWQYFGRNFSFPKWDRIVLSCVVQSHDPCATAADVFRALKLPLDQLMEIFPSKDPIKDYDDLGCCALQHDAGWTALARLINRTLHVWNAPSDQENSYVAGIYAPDGTITRPEPVLASAE